jgi:hypothetical protein
LTLTLGLGARYASGIVCWETKFTLGPRLVNLAICSVERSLDLNSDGLCFLSLHGALSLEGEGNIDVDTAIGVLENDRRLDPAISHASKPAEPSTVSPLWQNGALFPGPKNGTGDANMGESFKLAGMMVELSLRETELEIEGDISMCLRTVLIDLEDDPVLA